MKTVQEGLTPAQRREFEDRGLLKLAGLIAPRAAAEMADRLWDYLATKHGLRRGAPKTWTQERPFQFQGISKSGAFARFASPGVRTLLDDLMGEARWAEPPHWGQPLVCFPTSGAEWRLPWRHWHIDGPVDPPDRREPVGRVFAILAPIEPRGGGTVVATGSHRIVMEMARRAGRQLSSADTRKRLKAEHAWFAELGEDDLRPDRNARFMTQETVVGDVPLRVEEMAGDPGDVWVMHQNALHAPAPNTRETPRLVVSQFVTMRKA